MYQYSKEATDGILPIIDQQAYLLSIIITLYRNHLLGKLSDWLKQRTYWWMSKPVLDQEKSLIFQHLAEKYSSPKGGALFAAFIDFKSAFDLIPRDKLWAKFEATNIDRRPFFVNAVSLCKHTFTSPL